MESSNTVIPSTIPWINSRQVIWKSPEELYKIIYLCAPVLDILINRLKESNLKKKNEHKAPKGILRNTQLIQVWESILQFRGHKLATRGLGLTHRNNFFSLWSVFSNVMNQYKIFTFATSLEKKNLTKENLH